MSRRAILRSEIPLRGGHQGYSDPSLRIANVILWNKICAFDSKSHALQSEPLFVQQNLIAL